MQNCASMLYSCNRWVNKIAAVCFPGDCVSWRQQYGNGCDCGFTTAVPVKQIGLDIEWQRMTAIIICIIIMVLSRNFE